MKSLYPDVENVFAGRPPLVGQSSALDSCNVPPNVSALYLQIREAHTRDGWHIGGPLVAERHHLTLQERQSASQSRPCALRWMTPFCDSMANVFSGVCVCACVRARLDPNPRDWTLTRHNEPADAYGAWPTAFFIFEKPPVRETWRLVYRSRPTQEAHIDVAHVLACLWSESGSP